MFKQFAVARFLIGFIVFILAFMVATLSYDVFFHFLTGGMFLLSLWIMKEAHENHRAELLKKDTECEDKILELQEKLDQKEAELNFLIQYVSNAGNAGFTGLP